VHTYDEICPIVAPSCGDVNDTLGAASAAKGAAAQSASAASAIGVFWNFIRNLPCWQTDYAGIA